MSRYEKFISGDETLLKFFSGKALLKLQSCESSLQQIESEVLQHGQRVKESGKAQKQSNSETKLEQQKSLMTKVWLETVETLKHLCVVQSMEGECSTHDDISPDKKILVIYLNEFTSQFEVQLRETSAMKTQKAQKIARLTDSTKILDKKIEALKNKHALRQAATKAVVSTKKRIIQSMEVEMSDSKKKCDEEILDIIHEGKVKITRKTGKTLAQVKEIQRSLESKEIESKENQRILLSEIQKLRDKKLKAEQALQTILVKFDIDVGSRADELEIVRKETKTEQRNFDVWQSTIAMEQKILYDKLMLEKAEEEHLEVEAKLKELRERKLALTVLKKWRKFIKKKKFLRKKAKKEKEKKKRSQ